MEPQIYMWGGAKEMFLSRHDFFVEQVKARVLGNFENMDEEADRVATEVYERIGSMQACYDEDLSSAAEAAWEHGFEFYSMLSDMKVQTTLGALASLYHQWDKQFRDFLERELSHAYDRQEVAKYCWQPNIGKLFEILENFGWSVRETQWFRLIDACRLIVNVYKHGKGRSFDELASGYPQYFESYQVAASEHPWVTAPSYEDLAVSEEQFDEIAGALRQFWMDFPERLFLVS